jgi:hypothetical protein
MEASIPIYCGKMNRNVPAYIWTPCTIADGRYKWPQGHSKPVGDRLHAVEAVERRFLKMFYASLPVKHLEQATGRTMCALKSIASKQGWRRENVESKLRQNLAIGRKQLPYPTFNEAQREYLQQCYKTNFWPSRGGQRYPSVKQRNDAIKAELEKKVAELGHPFKWKAICCHIIHQQPGYARWHKQYRQRQKQKIE